MEKIKDKLFTPCIFRGLLADEVLDALFSHVKHPSVASYADFLSRLYNANSGDLGEYIKELCRNSENSRRGLIRSATELTILQYRDIIICVWKLLRITLRKS